MTKLDQSLNHQLKLSGCSAALWRGGGLQQAPVKFCHCYHHILQVYYSLSLLAMRWCTRLAPALCHFWWRRCWVLQWRSEFSCHWWPRLRSWRESMTLSTSLLKRVASFNQRRWQFQGETFIRSSLIISPIWLSTWFCDFARCCSSTWRAYWWLCLWWRWRCWDSVATSCRSCLHLARLSPGFLYPKSYSPMLLWLLLLSLLSGEVLEKSW